MKVRIHLFSGSPSQVIHSGWSVIVPAHSHCPGLHVLGRQRSQLRMLLVPGHHGGVRGTLPFDSAIRLLRLPFACLASLLLRCRRQLLQLQLAPSFQRQPPQAVVSQRDHLAVLGIRQRVELVYRVSKVSRQKDTDGDAVGDKDVVLGAAGFEGAPEGVEEGRDPVEHVGGRFSVRESVIERPEPMPLRLGLLDHLRILIIAEILLPDPRVLVPRQSHLHQLRVPQFQPFAPVLYVGKLLRVAPRRHDAVERLHRTGVGRHDEVHRLVRRQLLPQRLAGHAGHLPPQFREPHRIVRLGGVHGLVNVALALAVPHQYQFGRQEPSVERQRILTGEGARRMSGISQPFVAVLRQVRRRIFRGRLRPDELFPLLFFLLVPFFVLVLLVFRDGVRRPLVELLEVAPVAILGVKVQRGFPGQDAIRHGHPLHQQRPLLLRHAPYWLAIKGSSQRGSQVRGVERILPRGRPIHRFFPRRRGTSRRGRRRWRRRRR
mmetsp:Transcript_14474/g.31476  ORF Transcript_14474/g.31476 Transcript_14474/m.31476 type:complete len:489 (+) Transcript_14474:165-1631(+)